MKNISVILMLFVSAQFASAQNTTLAFEPYVDAQYACLWIEGANTRIPFEASVTEVEEAVQLASQSVGQLLKITCNQDRYECVHKDGDVRPGLVYRHSESRELRIIGGRIVDAVTGKEAAQVGAHYYHQNLRRLPRCH